MAQVTGQSACEYCRLECVNGQREVRYLVMYNGSVFRVCRAHFEQMSSRCDDGTNGYETAAAENGIAWKFPQWNSLSVAQTAAVQS